MSSFWIFLFIQPVVHFGLSLTDDHCFAPWCQVMIRNPAFLNRIFLGQHFASVTVDESCHIAGQIWASGESPEFADVAYFSPSPCLYQEHSQ